jgi:hypothetical protein
MAAGYGTPRQAPFAHECLNPASLTLALAQHLALERTLHHEERDFLLEMWSRDRSAIDLNEAVR